MIKVADILAKAPLDLARRNIQKNKLQSPQKLLPKLSPPPLLSQHSLLQETQLEGTVSEKVAEEESDANQPIKMNPKLENLMKNSQLLNQIAASPNGADLINQIFIDSPASVSTAESVNVKEEIDFTDPYESTEDDDDFIHSPR